MKDYPEEEELKVLNSWDVINDSDGFVDYLTDLWNYDYGKIDIVKRGKLVKMVIITGGWSGNEDIVAKIPVIFKMMNWKKSERGGKHTYKWRTAEINNINLI